MSLDQEPPSLLEKLFGTFMDKATAERVAHYTKSSTSWIFNLLSGTILAAIVIMLRKDVLALAMLAVGFILGGVIIGTIAWGVRGKRDKIESYEQKWDLVDNLTQRHVENHKMYVEFDSGRRPVRWDVEKRIRCVGQSATLEYIPGSIWYDGGMESIEIRAINTQASPSSIEIQNKHRLSDHRYNFMIKLRPLLSSSEEPREFRYQIKLHNPGVAKPYMASGWPNNRGTTKSTMGVQFSPDCLPKGGIVRKVYWPNGVGEDWTECKLVDLGEVTEDQNWEVDFVFTEAEIKLLDQQYDGDPEQRHYGLIWEW